MPKKFCKKCGQQVCKTSKTLVCLKCMSGVCTVCGDPMTSTKGHTVCTYCRNTIPQIKVCGLCNEEYHTVKKHSKLCHKCQRLRRSQGLSVQSYSSPTERKLDFMDDKFICEDVFKKGLTPAKVAREYNLNERSVEERLKYLQETVEENGKTKFINILLNSKFVDKGEVIKYEQANVV